MCDELMASSRGRPGGHTSRPSLSELYSGRFPHGSEDGATAGRTPASAKIATFDTDFRPGPAADYGQPGPGQGPFKGVNKKFKRGLGGEGGKIKNNIVK